LRFYPDDSGRHAPKIYTVAASCSLPLESTTCSNKDGLSHCLGPWIPWQKGLLEDSLNLILFGSSWLLGGIGAEVKLEPDRLVGMESGISDDVSHIGTVDHGTLAIRERQIIAGHKEFHRVGRLPSVAETARLHDREWDARDCYFLVGDAVVKEWR